MTKAPEEFSPKATAEAFIEARASSGTLPTYPGPFPPDLSKAYAAQDAAIDKWPDEIAGWKVGRIPEPFAGQLGADRLIGPIFSQLIKSGTNEVVQAGIYGAGFAAVEGEFILEIAEDAPADKTEWSLSEARDIAARVCAGIEIASSPVPAINDHGPLVTITDFGNNYGLIKGPELRTLLDMPPDYWECETYVDGEKIGAANAAGMPGGPIESLRYALSNAAARGRPLKKGMLISTGAVTGVHQVHAGQHAEIRFVTGVSIRCAFEDNGIHQHAAE